VIDELVEDLKSDEGWRPWVYDDETGEPISKGSTVHGYPTIGYGQMVDYSRGGGITKHIGEQMLIEAATLRWNQLVNLLPFVQHQPEEVQRALGNMAYQLGVGGVYGFKKMLQALRDGDRVAAAQHALDSKWANEQTPKRARRVAGLIGGYGV